MELKFGLENLPKTWFFDLDGTLVVHNGFVNGDDILLPNVLEFFEQNVKENDIVVITTARKEKHKETVISFLNKNKIKFNHIIFNLTVGVRVLVNDKKPDGSLTAYSINLDRNKGF